jgi:DNA-binding CsgD family transcriptional regulator
VGDVLVPVEAPAGRLTSPVLVGRERELALLVEAATRPPSLVVLEGEAGVGKTRLVEELLARPELAGRARYEGRCQQLGEPFPLGPIVEALRGASLAQGALSPVAGALRPLLPELADRLPPSPDPLGDRRAERHRLFRAMRELLGALGPSVLVLEDLHWDDGSTVELLSFLASQLPADLTLVCTYRREDLAPGSLLLGLAGRLPREVQGVQVSLLPLGKDEVRELVRKILDAQDVSDEFADHLLEDSGGLPFAVEEILRLLRDRDDVVRQRGMWVRREIEQIGVPLALRDAILERLRRLDPQAQRLVEAASVLGTPSAEDVLLAVADLDDGSADRPLGEALSSALLLEVSEGRYGFRHMLARQAVAEAIPTPARRRLHVRAATALETALPTPHAGLAHHYREAGKTDEWIAHAEAAADRAESLEDDATAYRFLKEAVCVPGLPTTTRARLALKLAANARRILALEEAIGILRPLLEDEALPPGTRGELRLWLSKLLISAGEHPEAGSEATRATEELSHRPALAASAMLCVAVPWGTEGSLEERLDWLDRAEEAAARSRNRVVTISVSAHRATFLLQTGDPRGWAAVDEIPAPRPVESEVDVAGCAYVNLADAALQLGYVRRANEFIAEGRRLLDEIGHSEAVLAFRINELHMDWLVGDWTDLESNIRGFLEDCEDAAKLRAIAEAVLGLLLLARGKVRAGVRKLGRLTEDFKGEPDVLTWVSGGLARLRLAEGRTDAAVEEAACGLAAVEREGVWAWATDVAPVAAEALLKAGRPAEAEDLAQRFALGLEGRDAPAASAALGVCRALLAEQAGEGESAARRYLSAAAGWEALPRPYDAARAREGAGRCLLACDTERGRQRLVEAMDAFRALGASWDATRVRRTLQEHGAIPPHRSGRKSYGDELSPREAEVARLAGEGLTNREIAGALFVAPKTVEQHLTAAMRKLGVKTRTDLPERLPPQEAATGA